MPIIKSAKKALRQSKKRRINNIQKKKKLKEVIKKIQSLIAEKKTKEAKALLPQVYKLLDKATTEIGRASCRERVCNDV